MKIEIEDYVLDKFKDFLIKEGLKTDEDTIKVKLNDFIELNLDLIL